MRSVEKQVNPLDESKRINRNKYRETESNYKTRTLNDYSKVLKETMENIDTMHEQIYFFVEIEVDFKNSNRNGIKYIAIETKYSFSVQTRKTHIKGK